MAVSGRVLPDRDIRRAGEAGRRDVSAVGKVGGQELDQPEAQILVK
jgi:hypothetical protein